MKIAYFGTPYFSADLLEKLIDDSSLDLEIAFAVTQPDKPVGKKHTLTASPVKLVAQKNNIPVFDNLEDIKDKLREVDFALVYAYGFKQLIPLDFLKAPNMRFGTGEGNWSGFINIHPSLLPRYRGSSPIAFPIFLGDELTGVTLFVMDAKMDHGPVVAQETLKIALNDVRIDMEKKLTDLGFEMVKKILSVTASSGLNLTPQNHSFATHAHYMTKEHGFLPYNTLQKALKNEPLKLQELPHIVRNYISKYHTAADSAGGFLPASAHKLPAVGIPAHLRHLLQNTGKTVYDFWRGMLPWPGIWTLLEPPKFDTIQKDRTSQVKWEGPKRLKITEMKYDNGRLTIAKVQLEGKNEVDFPTFQKAYGLFR